MPAIKSSTKISLPVLIALALNIGIALSYIGLWVVAARDNLLWRSDFSAYYTGGAIVRHGLGSRLYDLDLQASYQQDFLAGESFSQGVLPFNSPPHLALLVAPLTRLSYSQAFFVWTFFQLLLLASLIALLLRLTQDWQPQERWLTITACMALPGLLRGFLLGAFPLLMLICLLGWYMAHKRNGDFLAGLWLIIGAVRPQILVCPSIASVIGRRWKTILVGVLGGLAIVAVCGITLGWKIWPDFIERLLASGNYFDEYGIDPASMYNFKGTLTLWLGKAQANTINRISLLVYLLSLISTVWLWRGKWDPQQPAFTLRVSLTLLMNTFFGLHVNLQDGLLIAVPGILLYEYLRQRELPHRVYAIFALSCPALFLIDEFFLSRWLPVRFAVIVMLIMLIWSGIYLRSENRSTARTENTIDDVHV